MRKRGLCVLGVGITMLALAAVALAVVPARPAAGKWKFDTGGGFTVNHARTKISGIHLAAGTCGATEPVYVLGSHKIHTTSRGGVTNWIVGKGVSGGDGIANVKVTVKVGAQKFAGGMYLIWGVGGFARDTEGLLQFGSGCQADLTFSK